mgnify:CR=1 FL=1
MAGSFSSQMPLYLGSGTTVPAEYVGASDPPVDGVAAAIGSTYRRTDTGQIYAKTGATDTDWSLLATGSVSTALLIPPKGGGSAGADSLATNQARATLLGISPKAINPGSNVTLRWAVVTAGSGFTWGEIGIATGAPALGSAPTLTMQGYADVAAEMAAVNPYTTNVPVSAGQAIAEGDYIWAIFAKASTGSPNLRTLAVDTLASGFTGRLTTAAWRPSSNIGVADVWTIDSAVTTGPMVFGYVY